MSEPGPSDWRIRPACPADAQAIETVRVTTWKQAFRGVVSHVFLDQLRVKPLNVERWRSGIESRLWICFVAEMGGQVVGFVRSLCARDDDLDGETVGEIGALYVHPDYWRRGMGRALMAEGEEALRGAGFAAAVLWTLAENQRTRRFYERLGWRTDGAAFTADWLGEVLLVRYRIEFRRPD